MQAYKVTHRKSGESYHLLADTAADAVTTVTLVLSDAEGAGAWEATLGAPSFPLAEGTVFDRTGRPVTSLEA